eukprot:2520712-Prymnesium_polylepis.1
MGLALRPRRAVPHRERPRSRVGAQEPRRHEAVAAEGGALARVRERCELRPERVRRLEGEAAVCALHEV